MLKNNTTDELFQHLGEVVFQNRLLVKTNNLLTIENAKLKEEINALKNPPQGSPGGQ